jgi:hypothetical protein
MNGYETFEIFQSLKLHFTTDKYDYFKYGGKTNVSITNFENRKDKYHYYKLSRKFNQKEELIDFIVSNFVEDSVTWIGDLLLDDAQQKYLKRQKVIQSLSYTFENDCKDLFSHIKDPNHLLRVVNGEYPMLLTMGLRKEVNIETIIILNKILQFIPVWTQQITDTIRWPDYRRKLEKYTAFLPEDVVKYKLILKKVINDN